MSDTLRASKHVRSEALKPSRPPGRNDDILAPVTLQLTGSSGIPFGRGHNCRFDFASSAMIQLQKIGAKRHTTEHMRLRRSDPSIEALLDDRDRLRAQISILLDARKPDPVQLKRLQKQLAALEKQVGLGSRG